MIPCLKCLLIQLLAPRSCPNVPMQAEEFPQCGFCNMRLISSTVPETCHLGGVLQLLRSEAQISW